MKKMKFNFCRSLLLTLLMLTMGVSGAWADYTYIILNTDGETTLLSQMSSTQNEVPWQIASPYADYAFYTDKAYMTEVNWNEVDADATIYVKYTAKTDANGGLDFNNTPYLIYDDGHKVPMRVVVRTNEKSLWLKYPGQDEKDNAGDTGNEFTVNTMPFYHNRSVWYLEGDPYHVKLRNKATGSYFYQNSSSNNGMADPLKNESEASEYSLLYTTSSRNTTQCAFYHIASQKFCYLNNGSNNGWRLDGNRRNNNNTDARIIIEQLPPLTVHVLDENKQEETTLSYYFRQGAAMPTFVPYSFHRAFTKGQKFYKDIDCTQELTAGTPINEALTDVYMTYEWDFSTYYGTMPYADKYLFSKDYPNTIYWHDISLNNSVSIYSNGNNTQIGKANNATKTTIDGNDGKYQWAFVGSPYAMKVVNRNSYKEDYCLSTQSTGAEASIWMQQEGEGVYATWELRTPKADYLNNGYNFIAIQLKDDNNLIYSIGQSAILGNRLDGTGAAALIDYRYNGGTKTGNTPNYQDDYKGYVGVTMGLQYHIIDLSGNKIIDQAASGSTISLPDDLRSPLVESYAYYTAATETGGVWTVDATTERSEGDNIPPGTNNIYVTYTAKTDIKLDGSQFYMLKYNTPTDADHKIYEEEGDLPKLGPNTPVYPYTNGKEGFNLYSTNKQQLAFRDGENTRTRYLWYFMGGDPYRLKIYSWNNTGTKYHEKAMPEPAVLADTDGYHAYFYTFDDNGTTRTSLTQTDREDNQPTDYMVLASGNDAYPFRLVTTNGQLEVSSFEHQWLNSKKSAVEALGTGRTTDWHHLTALTFPNGGQVGENEDHVNLWYQTVETGSAFQIEDAELHPVLHLVDKHGWEIAHWNITGTQANKDEIAKWNSPMVEKYKWYKGNFSTNASNSGVIFKETGYYKYQFKGVKPDRETTDLTDWTSGTAIDLVNVANNWNFYVTYDVKDEYLLYSDERNNGVVWLIKQNGKVAGSDDGSAISNTDDATNNVYVNYSDASEDLHWRLDRNHDIDKEMGYLYAGETGAEAGALSKEATEALYTGANAEYYNNPQGVDPYNLRIANDQYPDKYITMPYTSEADKGKRTVDTESPLTLTDATTVLRTEPAMSDHFRQVTGTTFMVVQDKAGNWRLASRFDPNFVISGLNSVAKFNVNSDNTQNTVLQNAKRFHVYVWKKGATGSPATENNIALDIFAKLGNNCQLSGDLLRAYCNYEYYDSYNAGTTRAEDTYGSTVTTFNREVDNLYIPYTTSVDFSEDYANANWYYLRLSSNWMQAASNVSGANVINNNNNATNENHQWAFIGDPYSFQMINRATGEDLYATAPASISNNSSHPTMIADGEGSRNSWTFVFDAQNNPLIQLYDANETYFLFHTGTLTNSTNNANRRITVLTPVAEITYHVKGQNSNKEEYKKTIYYMSDIGTPSLTETSAHSLPDALVRMGCKNYDYYTGNFKDETGAARIAEDALLSDIYPASEDIYVYYEIDETTLPLILSTASTPVWHNIQAGDQATRYFYTTSENDQLQSDVSTNSHDGLSGDAWLHTDALQWAFFGTPYRLQVVNKLKETNKYLREPTTAETASSGRARLDAGADGASNLWEVIAYDEGTRYFSIRIYDSYGSERYLQHHNGWYFGSKNNNARLEAVAKVDVTYHIYKATNTATPVATMTQSEHTNYMLTANNPSAPVYKPFCDYLYYTEDTWNNGYPAADAGVATIAELNIAYGATCDIYITYSIPATSPVQFYDYVENAFADKTKWMFLMLGYDGTYYTDGNLQASEQTFLRHNSSRNGHRFLCRGGDLTTPDEYGHQETPEGDDLVTALFGKRSFSDSSAGDVDLLSKKNDFRRIAETYKDGYDVGFREGRWLWAFIGTPWSFQVVNREAGQTKRLVASTSASTYNQSIVYLSDNYGDLPINYELSYLSNDLPEGTSEKVFGLSIADDLNLTLSNSSSFATKGKVMNPDAGSYDKLIFSGLNGSHKNYSITPYLWKWSDNKYKTVTVNIYKNNVSGTPVLTKTYTPANRAFMAGDVIDGTDGHFYLPHESGEWNDNYDVSNPTDNHLVNIPYELRRRFCNYVVDGSSTAACIGTLNGKTTFTVQDTNEEQTLNIIYQVDTDNAPRFLTEEEVADFRKVEKDEDTYTNATYGTQKKMDYYYFIDMGRTLSQHQYAGEREFTVNGQKVKVHQDLATGNRFLANDVEMLKWYFVGDPYQVRLFNVYTDEAYTDGKVRNLVRNRFTGGKYGSLGNDAQHDNTLYMEDEEHTNGKFTWEMVDATPNGYGYYCDTTNENINFRKDMLQQRVFALRMRDIAAESPNADQTTYYYVNNGSTTNGSPIYQEGGYSTNPRQNVLNAFATYPDTRHKANQYDANTLAALQIARVYVSAYDQDEPTKFATKDERSDYYAVGDHFEGVPANLQRNYCHYTWASTEPDPNNQRKNNMLADDGYFEVITDELSMYVRYEETENSPFSKVDTDGNVVLKKGTILGKDAAGKHTVSTQSPWFNMYLNGNTSNTNAKFWAYFNSNIEGKHVATSTSDSEADQYNTTVLSFPYSGNIGNVTDRFHKGMHWALIGDPYNFTLRCHRDRIIMDGDKADTSSGDYEYEGAYLYDDGVEEFVNSNVTKKGSVKVGTESQATVWTWMRKATTSDAYFLSESTTRRTEVDKKKAPRRLPPDYTIDSQPTSLNFFINKENEFGIISGNNYALTSNMDLVTVNDAQANNESFDAIVNVYNKLNELVATTGWTELQRNSPRSYLPADVMRWGCTYNYWTDETMTKYPFTSYSQTGASGNYLIPDKGIVYVNYNYDESLYSSENEYRWVNLFFNWNEQNKKWTKDDVVEDWYTAEKWEWQTTMTTDENGQETTSGQWYLRNGDSSDRKRKQVVKKWQEHLTNEHTKEGWVETPKTSGNGYTVDKAYAYNQDGQYSALVDSRKQKWALIGDPYRFILYNYYRMQDTKPEGTNLYGNNSYYLRYTEDEGIVNKVLDRDISPEAKANMQGLYWTWKTNNTKYRFAKGEGDNATEYYQRTGLPTSFYYRMVVNGNDTTYVKDTNDQYVETGYLAVCDMEATALYDKKHLVGSVLGYASFDHDKKVEKYADSSGSAVDTQEAADKEGYTKGNPYKYKVYYPAKTVTKNDATVNGQTTTIRYVTDDTDAASGTIDYTKILVNTDANYNEAKANAWKQLGTHTSGEGTDGDGDGIYDSDTGPYAGNYIGPTPEPTRTDYTYRKTQVKVDATDPTAMLTLSGGASVSDIRLNTGDAERFLVMPSTSHALSVTFHLDNTGNTKSQRDWTNDPIPDFTTEHYGVDNTLTLPWMMRRQYCDYKYYVVENGDVAPADKTGAIDHLKYDANEYSNAHAVSDRTASAYKKLWGQTGTEITPKNGDILVPEEWNNKHIYLRVTYQPNSEWTANVSTDGTDASKVNWLTIANEQKGNLMRYTRSKEVTGENSLNDQTTNLLNDHLTNDYLWAIEGDPYGFKLRNRYAVHGFDGTLNEHWTDKVLATSKVNTTEKFNYTEYTVEGNDTTWRAGVFTKDGSIKSGLTFAQTPNGSQGSMGSPVGSGDNFPIYEAMTGNYSDAMLLHPVEACINAKNQNGYKYFSAFLFNGLDWPVQLNYMAEWDAMRNVFANWRLQPLTAAQLLPYFTHAGYVGALKADVASTNSELFGKLNGGTATNDEIAQARQIVHNPAKIVPLENNHYYRVRKYDPTTTGDYLSGYLHKLELDNKTPLHTYSTIKAGRTLASLETDTSNPWAEGIEQKIDIPAVDYDPSSIFRLTKDENSHWALHTQGLVVSENILTEIPEELTEDEKAAMNFEIQDIGIAAMQIRSKVTLAISENEERESHYLSYNPGTARYALNNTAHELNQSDGLHDTQWLLEPVEMQGLKLKLNKGGDGKYYSTLYLPYDIKLPEGVTAETGGKTNLTSVIEGDKYHFHGRFQLTDAVNAEGVVPAGTPMLIKAENVEALTQGAAAFIVPAQVPTETTQDPFLKGVYLTQNLEQPQDEEVKYFVFGQSGGVPGFYVNATKNYQGAKDNTFIPHHKMYFQLTNRQQADLAAKGYFEFDYYEDMPTEINDSISEKEPNGIIYDLAGRKVEHINKPGVYIRNGKKFVVKSVNGITL